MNPVENIYGRVAAAGVGAPIFAFGVDYGAAGVNQAIYGKPAPTVTQQTLQELNVPENEANAYVNGWAFFLTLQPVLQRPQAAGLMMETINPIENILVEIAKGKEGNYGLGSATYDDAIKAGEEWVGKGYRVSKDGSSWISEDGLRQFRPPSYKPKLGITQANFQWRTANKGAWVSNGHLDIR